MLSLNHENLVLSANALPPLPQAVTKLNELFADADYEVRDVVRAVELDPVLAGKLLRMANSVVYGSGGIGSISEAVVRVGAGSVKSLALASSVRPAADLNLKPFGLTPESYWKHCVAVLSYAEELSSRRVGQFGNDLAMAALLHDFGKLVLAKHLTPDHVEALEQFPPTTRAVDREMKVLGVTHAEVTAVVAQSWNLPETLVYATQHHHDPESVESPMCHGLNIANQLAWRLEDRRYDLAAEAKSLNTSTTSLNLTSDLLDSIFEAGTARLEASLEAYT